MHCPHCRSEIQYGATKCPRCTGDITYRSYLSDDMALSLGKYTALGGAILLPLILGYFGFVDSLNGYLISAGVGACFGFAVPFGKSPSAR